MKNKLNLYKKIKNILKEIRFGKLSARIEANDFPDDKEFINDFNNMLETLEYRENMGKEFQDIMYGKNKYLETLFNLINDGIMTLSEDFKILAINDTFSTWLRKTKSKLINSNIIEILKKYDIYVLDTNVKIDYKKILASDKKNYKLCFKLKNINVYFSVNVKKFIDEKGKQNYFIFAKNITNDINLQKMKNSFIATLTHDLKVPILAEAKVLELFQNETFGKNSSLQSEAINNLFINNKGMLDLVTTLLDIYKLEDAVYKINPSTFDVIDFLKTEIQTLNYLTKEKNCNIILDNKIKRKNISADKKELSRVIKNIVINAIDFSLPNCNIKVCVSIKDNKIFISITNKGVGIEKEYLPFIFDRYFTKKYRKIGTGLGLYLSKKIIQLHHGDIDVESVLNKETTFIIKLPL